MYSESDRKRRNRRKRILSWVPYAVMGILAIVAVILAIGFNNSWWVEKNPVASADQQYRGESVFTPAGIDYSGRVGHVTISLAANRPAAAKLGLPRTGTRTFTYIVPLTIAISADGPAIRQTAVDTVTIRTSAGRIAAVRFTDDAGYPAIHQRAVNLITSTAGTAAAASFDASLASTKAASGDRRYDAVSATSNAGIQSRVELKGTAGTTGLTIELSPESN